MGGFALVTGASSGIGLEICRSLAKRGVNVILTSRSENKLKRISEEINLKYKVETAYFSCDLADDKGPQKIYDYCESKNYKVEILVNNAGYALPNSFEENSVEDEEKMYSSAWYVCNFINKIIFKKYVKKWKRKNNDCFICCCICSTCCYSGFIWASQNLYEQIQ